MIENSPFQHGNYSSPKRDRGLEKLRLTLRDMDELALRTSQEDLVGAYVESGIESEKGSPEKSKGSCTVENYKEVSQKPKTTPASYPNNEALMTELLRICRTDFNGHEGKAKQRTSCEADDGIVDDIDSEARTCASPVAVDLKSETIKLRHQALFDVFALLCGRFVLRQCLTVHRWLNQIAEICPKGVSKTSDVICGDFLWLHFDSEGHVR